MSRKKIHIDEAISSKLEQLQPEFNPAHWDALENELNKRETGFWFIWTTLISFYSKFKSIIMTTVLSTILVFFVALFGGKQASEKVEDQLPSTSVETTADVTTNNPLTTPLDGSNKQMFKDTSRNSKITKALNTLVSAAEGNSIIQISNSAVQLLNEELSIDTDITSPIDSPVLELVDDGVERKLVKKVWVPAEYEECAFQMKDQ